MGRSSRTRDLKAISLYLLCYAVTDIQFFIMSSADDLPANTACLTTACLMLGQRRGRWSNFKPAVDQCLLGAGRPVGNHMLAAHAH